MKTNIIHLVIVGVLTIGFISGCKKEEDPKYKSLLCPRCNSIVFKGLPNGGGMRFLGSRCKTCGLKFGMMPGEGRPFIPYIEGRPYSRGSHNDAQIAKWLAEAEAEEAAKAKAEREYEEAMYPESEEAEEAP